MIRAPVTGTQRAQKARVKSVPAPTGGWNARDSIANMPPSDAVILTNWFPTASDTELRNGFTNLATGLGNQVQSLMGYNPASGTPKLFAAAGGSVYDVTSGGAVGSPAITSLSNAKWKHTNFATSAGPFLLMVNGQDGYYVYNGSTWQSVTSGSSPISITGIDPTTLSDVSIFASRVWFIQKSSLKAWYLPVGQVGGAATSFDFSPIFFRGGSLVAMGVWTVDGGYGMQDYFCLVTSEGEIAVYQGTDPSSSSTWSKVGVYRVGTPMGNRCFMKFGGDLLYLSKDGAGPISKLLASSRVNTQVNITDKIQTAISQATTLYSTNFGWQMQLFPSENILIINVPVSLGGQQQYVMNTITGAWCNFTGWSANCWELFQDKLYFGGNGVVCQAWNGLDDNGVQIVGEMLPAFQYFDSPQLKQFTMVRPIFLTNGFPSVLLGINTDFESAVPIGVPTFSPQQAAVWDQGLWDVAIWGQDPQIVKNWEYVSGIGYTGALHLKVAAQDISVRLASIDYAMIDGGVM
jgi:hypothetical protein